MSDEKKSSGGKWKLVLLLIVVLIGLGLYSMFSFTISEGYQAGALIRFESRGVMFKTYEGQLNIGAVGNVANTAQMNQTWDFSVKDKATADSLMHFEGRKVSLHYRQKIKSLPWQGETHYFVDKVDFITP
jgi:hypothetical protein